MIQQADAVCGFISTALLEALAAGKPVIQPCFAEATDESYSDYLLDLGEASANATDPEHLIALLATTARRRAPVTADLHPAAAVALQRWTGNNDGKAGQRVAAAVAEEIEANRATQPLAHGAR